MQVVVPPGMAAGMTMQVPTRWGTAKAKIPPGLQPGGKFLIQLPKTGAAAREAGDADVLAGMRRRVRELQAEARAEDRAAAALANAACTGSGAANTRGTSGGA